MSAKRDHPLLEASDVHDLIEIVRALNITITKSNTEARRHHQDTLNALQKHTNAVEMQTIALTGVLEELRAMASHLGSIPALLAALEARANGSTAPEHVGR